MFKNLSLPLLVIFFASCGTDTNRLRPTLATLKHDINEKFIGHDGIKRLCETHLGMRYLMKPEIAFQGLKNRSKQDLIDPRVYENDELQYGNQIHNGYLVNSYVKFIDDDFGYGMFAGTDTKKDELIGEYTGIIVTNQSIEDSSWAWQYPKEIYKLELALPKLSLNAQFAGNAVRFVNHHDKPNVEMRRIFLDGMVRTFYVAIKDIGKDEQIFVNYGQNYWVNRKKK